MEHLEAREMHAAEKYVLGEMSEELRDEFEEHYLDCPECALDVRAAVAFVANSKEVFREEQQAVPTVRERKQKAKGWAAWLKPLIAVPAIAVLVVALIYEKHHVHTTIPSNVVTQTQVVSASFGLRGGEREASVNTNVRVHAAETFGLHFDFTPGRTFAQYTAELRDSSGRILRQFPISAERINKEVNLVVPGTLAVPGNYQLLIYGKAGGTAPATGPAAGAAIASYAFSIEIIP